MSWLGSALSLGSSLIGAGASIFGAERQADATRDASEAAGRISERQYDQTRADLARYRDVGESALNRLYAALYGGDYSGLSAQPGYEASYTASPGYEFRVQEGVNAIDRAASARGMLGSGARAKALTRFGQDTAAQDFGQWQARQDGIREGWLNRTGSLAQSGLSAAGATSNAGAQAASLGAQAALAGGQAGGQSGAGYVGAANALAGGANNYLLYDMLRNRPTAAGSSVLGGPVT